MCRERWTFRASATSLDRITRTFSTSLFLTHSLFLSSTSCLHHTISPFPTCFVLSPTSSSFFPTLDPELHLVCKTSVSSSRLDIESIPASYSHRERRPTTTITAVTLLFPLSPYLDLTIFWLTLISGSLELPLQG